MATPPLVLGQLVEARQREDWDAVGGLIDWLAAGVAGPHTDRLRR